VKVLLKTTTTTTTTTIIIIIIKEIPTIYSPPPEVDVRDDRIADKNEYVVTDRQTDRHNVHMTTRN